MYTSIRTAKLNDAEPPSCPNGRGHLSELDWSDPVFDEVAVHLDAPVVLEDQLLTAEQEMYTCGMNRGSSVRRRQVRKHRSSGGLRGPAKSSRILTSSSSRTER